ncbi:hypothetical protein UlMin_027282 [Ulmus minor]
MFFSPPFFLAFLLFFYLPTSSFAAAQLPKAEVEALKEIGEKLGIRKWNFSVDPCSGEEGWIIEKPLKGFDNNLTCNCTFSNNTLCHVVSIILKAQNLPGTFPPELAKLPYLEQIDLSRNYINGTIPPEWGSMKLVNISLLGNRLTGSIPKELANITTLKSLVLEFNHMSGTLPPQLGNLPNIERLHLTSNNFSGELPDTFAKLTTLKDFRIGDNHFSGKIPNFIQNWTNLQKLVIQASGLSGPIPSGIASLEKLTDLRISDLNGTEATFPPLNNMTKMKTLMLRSCNIVEEIPEYLGHMTNLKTLDLSFNKLSGQIPPSFVSLTHIDYIFLTGNLLSGKVPDWLLKGGKSIDLSYNNFTSGESSCETRNVNLFASSSRDNSSNLLATSSRNNSSIAACLRSFRCPQTRYSVHINCGGKEVTINGTTYEDDTDRAGPSSFFQRSNWAFSSTGYFPDDDVEDSLTLANSSRLSITHPELYMSARLSPISLTYYAFCLGNGKYTVRLHFAEIMFTDDKTYSSLGRRVFDVYVQGKLVLKDFNFADEAGGVGREVIKKFPAVVSRSTLEIRFYWAGRGTTGIPDRGVYGPLVSAISVDPDFIPPSPPSAENGNSISVGTIVGIVVAGVLVVLLVIGILWWKCCLRQKSTLEKDLKGLDLKTGKFTLRQIKAATNDFDAANKIGEGGFGSVYKGLLSDGTVIAVKQLSSKSKQGNREFLNEIGMISALQHPHLVKLYGCCIEGDQLLLVYEYLINNNVARALFGPEETRLKLDWPMRRKICVGIARGLAYLHEESRLKIVHRDIKATNILLDKDLNAKISDFGLAKLDEEDNTHISTRIAGTYGYMAPEYAMRGYLTDKADVYSYGVVVLEIISGRSNTTYRSKEECFYLLDWAHVLKEEGNLIELVDPKLGSEYNKEEVMLTINVALLCANAAPSVRPAMSSVVSMLEGQIAVEEPIIDPSVSNNDIETMRNHYQHDQNSQTQSSSIEGPWTNSSSSAPDLYPVNPDSDYWEKRN